MAHTLEEVVLSSIDTLFQGAHFLSGGRRHDAERLVEDTVLAAYHEAVQSGPPRDERELSVLMARTFLAQIPDQPTRPNEPVGATSPVDLTADGIFEAAARVSPRSRAALWLVLIRRWSYAEACNALRVDEPHLRRLLAERHGFMEAFEGRALHERGPEAGGAVR